MLVFLTISPHMIICATVSISSSRRPRKTIEVSPVPANGQEESPSGDAGAEISYSQDKDASWTVKGKMAYYGYKGHVVTDSRNGFVLCSHVTPAHYSDTREFKSLVRKVKLPEKSRVYADKGYASRDNRSFLKSMFCKDGIMSKGQRNHPLSLRSKKRNKLISKVRYIIERCFGTLKRTYGLSRTRYLGQAKVGLELFLASIAFNLKKAAYMT